MKSLREYIELINEATDADYVNTPATQAIPGLAKPLPMGSTDPSSPAYKRANPGQKKQADTSQYKIGRAHV